MRVGDEFYWDTGAGIEIGVVDAIVITWIVVTLPTVGQTLVQALEKDARFKGWTTTTAIPAPSFHQSPAAASFTYTSGYGYGGADGKTKCPDCKTELEHKKLNTFEYDYCPTCKKEVETVKFHGKDYYD